MLALLHTFITKQHVELVFGGCALLFLVVFAAVQGPSEAVDYLGGLSFTEPLFVFAIMAMAATRPVLELARLFITALARRLPLPGAQGFFVATLVVGPLLGSLITEPAAMTVTALLLRDSICEHATIRLRYATLGLLFVNVSTSHHPIVFGPIFVAFIGLTWLTRAHQDELRIGQGLMVGFFLAGLVVLGTPQRVWLEPALTALSDGPLFVAATALTAVTDNAALTYLGSLVPDLTDASRYALLAGALAGGGLTLIANAPNPAGQAILSPTFGPEGPSPWHLFVAALVPTALAMAGFAFLP